jgi:hypothetical protein
VHERLHAGFDDGFGLCNGRLAIFDAGLHEGTKIVDGV